MTFAQQIAQGHIEHLQLRTPGYPLFLLLTGSSVTPTRLLFYAQLWVHFASISCLAYLLFFLRVKPRLIGAFTLIALLPPFVEPAAWVLSETLTTLSIVVAFTALVLWLHTRRALALVIFALAAMSAPFVRPTYELLVPVMGVGVAAAILLRCIRGITLRRFTVAMLLPLVLAMGCLSAYSFWNYKRFGYYGTSSLSPLALSTKTVTVIEYLPPEFEGLKQILLKYRDRNLLVPGEDHTALNYIHRALPEVVQYYGGDPVKAATELRRMNIALIKAKPMSYILESSKLLFSYWMPDERKLSDGDSSIRRAASTGIQLLVTAAFFPQEILLFSALAFWLSLRLFGARIARDYPSEAGLQAAAWLVGSAMILYTAAVSCAFSTGIPRYRTPIDLLIMAVSVIGYSLWIRAAQSAASSPERTSC